MLYKGRNRGRRRSSRAESSVGLVKRAVRQTMPHDKDQIIELLVVGISGGSGSTKYIVSSSDPTVSRAVVSNRAANLKPETRSQSRAQRDAHGATGGKPNPPRVDTASRARYAAPPF